MKVKTRSFAIYRNLRAWLALAIALMVLAFVLLNYALQPKQVAGLLLAQAGKALGLEITAGGVAEYGLRGDPTLVLREVVARQPGAATPLMRADRLYIALPWSSIRARGSELTATRLELDAPVLDLPALQQWLATRPPSETRLPTLRKGLKIRDGRVVNGGGDTWRIEAIDVDVPSLAPDRPLHARLRGRYLDPPLAIPVDLAVAIIRPGALVHAQPSGFAAVGTIAIQRGGDWRLPSTVTLSGPLTVAKDAWHVTPARLGMSARYESGGRRLPFSLGAHGPLRFDHVAWTLAPSAIALRGRGANADEDPIPTLDARGSLALGQHLTVQLHGDIAGWPLAWPALPPPLSASTSPLAFDLRYDGKHDLSQVAWLQLQRDTTVLDGRFRLWDVTDWIAKDEAGKSLLPPLDGTLTTPRLEIAGAQLEGIEATFDDPEIADPGVDTPNIPDAYD